MPEQQNDQGFSGLMTVLIIAIVAIIGGAGYYVWHANNKPTTVTATASSAQKTTKPTVTTATADPYAGWLQYCSTGEKACFKYPADWQATTIDASDPGAGAGIKLTSPAGTVVRYQSAISGIGGGCDETTDPHIFVVKVIPLPKVTGMYVVETGTGSAATVNHIGLSDNQGKGAPALGDVGDCIYYTVFKAKNDPAKADGWFETTTTTAYNASDLPTLEKMIESYYYQ